MTCQIKLPIMSFRSKTRYTWRKEQKKKRKRKVKLITKIFAFPFVFPFLFCFFFFSIFYEIFAFLSHLIFNFENTYNMIKCTTLIAFSFIYLFIKKNKVVNDMSIQIEIAFCVRIYPPCF